MCDLTKSFKLCSCDKKQLKQENIDWILQRIDTGRPIQHKRGRAAIQRFNVEEETLRNNIEESLNTQNCFDFDFQPQENDRLQIRYNEDSWFAYRYQKGEWQKDNSTSLDGWRSLLDNHKNGKLC